MQQWGFLFLMLNIVSISQWPKKLHLALSLINVNFAVDKNLKTLMKTWNDSFLEWIFLCFIGTNWDYYGSLFQPVGKNYFYFSFLIPLVSVSKLKFWDHTWKFLQMGGNFCVCHWWIWVSTNKKILGSAFASILHLPRIDASLVKMKELIKNKK